MNNGMEEGATVGVGFKGYDVVWCDIAIVTAIPVRLSDWKPTSFTDGGVLLGSTYQPQ